MAETKTVRRGRLLNSRELYENGANSPTVVETYRCPCRRGTVVRTYVPGFNDDSYSLECERCLKKFDFYVESYDNKLVLYYSTGDAEEDEEELARITALIEENE